MSGYYEVWKDFVSYDMNNLVFVGTLSQCNEYMFHNSGGYWVIPYI